MVIILFCLDKLFTVGPVSIANRHAYTGVSIHHLLSRTIDGWRKSLAYSQEWNRLASIVSWCYNAWSWLELLTCRPAVLYWANEPQWRPNTTTCLQLQRIGTKYGLLKSSPRGPRRKSCMHTGHLPTHTLVTIDAQWILPKLKLGVDAKLERSNYRNSRNRLARLALYYWPQVTVGFCRGLCNWLLWSTCRIRWASLAASSPARPSQKHPSYPRPLTWACRKPLVGRRP